MKRSTSYIVALSLTIIIAFILLGLAVYTLVGLKVLPVSDSIIFYAVIIAGGGTVITLFLSSMMKRLSDVVGEANSSVLQFLVRLLGFIITAVALLSLFKVSADLAYFGGTAIGLILGLASQDVLSNIFGGLVILFSRPFKVGDRVTISTWQYGLLAPTYQPKFWSNDFLIPGYTGRITEIALMYTTVITDENIPLKIPNSIMVQAAVFIHGANEHRVVRTKYEIPKDIEPDLAISELKRELSKLDVFAREPEIRILDTTLNTYVIVIEALCKGEFEEPPRSEIIKIVMRTVRQLQLAKQR
ncbi:mechanosensitive ion channel protein MscS [Sulfolobales archaeon HS-7]|nr:mechanosensitive ion channel protein MscS [Sulfolobales archaeon HS-7]